MYGNWGFARMRGIGWGWAGVIWLYSIIFYIPLDILKFIIRYALSGKAWDNLLQNKVIDFFLITTLQAMLRDLCNIFLPIFDHPLNCTILSRLLSRQRRIMEGKRGRHNGLQLNELYMGCNLQKHQNSSMIRTTLGNCLKSLNMPRDVLKLPGNVQGS